MSEQTTNTSASIPTKAKQISSAIFLHLLAAIGFFCIIFIVFADQSFLGLFPVPILANEYFIGSLVLIMTFLLSRHLIRLKLVLWRIFLQTIFSTTSRLYKFFAHGYMVRVIAVVLSLGMSLNIIVFMSLISVHKTQYISLCIGYCIFYLCRIHSKYGVGASFIRSDVNAILKSYLMPFMLATMVAMATTVWEIYTIDEFQKINGINDAMEIALRSINSAYLWPVRVMARHIYAYELLMQQVANVPVMGKALYFIYMVLTEGAITFFSIFLLGMPYKKEETNEKA